MDVTIYSLSDPRTGEIRYVGKTVMRLAKRLNAHIGNSHKSRVGGWIKSIIKIGLRPSIESLEVIENSNDEDWQDVERFYISYLRFLGCNLTNAKAGGMGGKSGQVPWNKGVSPSEEVRKKISAKLMGRKHWPSGRVFTKDHCNNISRGKIGKPAANKGRPMSLEQRKKMEAKAWRKGKKHTPEACLKMSAAQFENWRIRKNKGGSI